MYRMPSCRDERPGPRHFVHPLQQPHSGNPRGRFRVLVCAAALGVSRSLRRRKLLFACRSCGYRWLPSSRKDPNCSAFAASAAFELPVASPAPAVTVCVAPALPLAETVTMTADLPMVVAGVAAGGGLPLLRGRGRRSGDAIFRSGRLRGPTRGLGAVPSHPQVAQKRSNAPRDAHTLLRPGEGSLGAKVLPNYRRQKATFYLFRNTCRL